MKNHLHKIGLSLAVVFVAYLFFFDYSAALTRRLPRLQAITAKNNFTFELGKLELLSPTALNFRKFYLVFDKDASNIPFVIDEGSVSTEILPFFLFDALFKAS